MVFRPTATAAFVLALAALPAAPALAAPKAEDFVKQATAATQFELEAAKIAAERAVSPAVKEYALKVVNNHKKADQDLESVAKAAGGPFGAPQFENAQLQTIDKLIKANVADLEKEFIKAQIDAHKKSVDLFNDYAKDGDNLRLKELAAKMVPDLEGHLVRVERLQDNR